MAKENKHGTWKVRGGVTSGDSEYGAGIPYYDNVSAVAKAMADAGYGTIDDNMAEIIRDNHLKLRNGRDCKTKEQMKDAVIHPGQVLNLRTDKEIHPDLYFQCGTKKAKPNPVMQSFDEPLVVGAAMAPAAPVPPAPLPLRVALPEYPQPGNTGYGKTADIYDAAELSVLLGRNPKQPVIAARGNNRTQTGVQTVVGTTGNVLENVITHTPIPTPLSIGRVALGLLPIYGVAKLDIGSSADRLQQARQGSDGASGKHGSDLEVAGRNARLDLGINPTDRTRRDATLWLMLGIQRDQDGNHVIDVPGSHFHNNELYSVTGQGEYAPSVTSSDRFMRTGKANTLLRGRPSAAVALTGFNNYALADQVNEQSIEPQIGTRADSYKKNPNKEDAQQLVYLMNYQMSMIGNTNFQVSADLSKPLDEAGTGKLNPLERIAYNRQRVLDQAAKDGITGLEVTANGLPALPDHSMVLSADRATLRSNAIAWYDELAKKDHIFKGGFKDQVGHEAKYDPKNDQQRLAVATEFVDSLQFLHTSPEKGVPLQWVDKYVLKREFNSVEKFEQLPKAAPKDSTAADNAVRGLAADPEVTRLLLEGAGRDTNIAATFAQNDLVHMGLPSSFEHGFHFSRAGTLNNVMDRGYRESLRGKVITREETNGIPRDFPDMQADIGKSAGNPKIVALRQKDIANMPNVGDNQALLAKGALGNQLLYALALEKTGAARDNTTLLAIEDHITKTDPAHAEARIETLKQGIEYAKEHVSGRIFGSITANGMAAYVAARSEVSAPGSTGAGIAATTAVDAAAIDAAVNPQGDMQAALKQAKNAGIKIKAPKGVTPLTTGAAEGFHPDTSRFVGLADIADQRLREVKTVTGFLDTKATSGPALNAIAAKNPRFATAAVIEALVNHPELLEPTLSALNQHGDQRTWGLLSPIDRLLNSHPQGKLAHIVKEFAEAQHHGDKKAMDKYMGQLEAFVKTADGKEGAANTQAINDLLASALGANTKTGTTGLTAVAATISAALNRAVAGTTQPLEYYNMNNNAVIDLAYAAVLTSAETGIHNTSVATGVMTDNMPTRSGGNLPFIITPVPKWGGHKDTPNNKGNVPGCSLVSGCDKPTVPSAPGSPAVPTGPVAPPPTPAVPAPPPPVTQGH